MADSRALKAFYTSSSSLSSCPKLPLLLLEHFFREDDNREFLDLSGKICNISLPQVLGMRYIGSKGWLCMVDPRMRNLCLFHPISGVQIPLPDIPTQTDSGLEIKAFYLRNFALSASPSETSDYVVTVVFHGERPLFKGYFEQGTYTGFWKPGNLTWTKVDHLPYVHDLNYFNGKFYALTNGRTDQVWTWDVSSPNPIASAIVELPWMGRSRPNAQLVECGGRLLIIAPNWTPHFDMSCIDYVVMVEIDVIKGSCNTITSLGNSAVFLGRNEAFSIDASSFPGIIESNSIYFGNGSHKVATPETVDEYTKYSATHPRSIGDNSPHYYGSGVWLNFKDI